MSFVVGTAIGEMNQELNLVGQRMSDTDYILFLNRTIKYFYTSLKLPTCQRSFDLIAYPGVKEYPLPTDFIGIIEPGRPYDLWSPNFEHKTERDFIHWPYGQSTSIKFVQETPFLIFNETGSSAVGVNSCDDLTAGGTWVISGDGSALALDNQIYTAGTGSLRFTVTASSGSTTLTCTSLSRVDITSYLTSGQLFLDLQLPSTNTVATSSVSIKIGTSASAYYTVSDTMRQRGDTILNGWGLIALDLTAATKVGSPDSTDIEYFQVTINHGLTGVNGTYRLDNIFLSTGVYYQVPYYSKYNVKASDGTYKERITATDDTVLSPSDIDEALTYKCLEIAASIRLRDQAQAQYYARELLPKENYLKSKYPRQESRLQTTWYKQTAGF